MSSQDGNPEAVCDWNTITPVLVEPVYAHKDRLRRRTQAEMRKLRNTWPAPAGAAQACVTVIFGVDQYIPLDLWQKWKPPIGWKKSGFYARMNRDPETTEFRLIFPGVRVYCYDLSKASGEDLAFIEAAIKLMQRPYP